MPRRGNDVLDQATVYPMHEWRGSEDGHNCAECPPESIWKCDERAHDHVLDPLEKLLSSHLPIESPEGWVLCLCADSFTGPAFHRRHVAGIIRAWLDGNHDPMTEGPFDNAGGDVADGH